MPYPKLLDSPKMICYWDAIKTLSGKRKTKAENYFKRNVRLEQVLDNDLTKNS